MLAGTTARSPLSTMEVAIVVNGVPQQLYSRATDDSLWVAGKPGKVYRLRVRNLARTRIEVINTVDGRNTLEDEEGDINDNRGLVFSSRSTGQFSGWRVDRNTTREFIFGSPERSVAAQATGSAENVGVIGLAAYREKERQPVYALNTVNYAGPQGMSMGVAAAASGPVLRGLGTGIGEVREDAVGSTTFTRSGPPDVLVINYDTYCNLEEMGLVRDRQPSAFPGSKTGYDRYSSQAA